MDPKNAHNIEQCYRLLATCARAEGHPLMDEQLRRQVAAFTAWDELPEQAELHGMGGLLWHHFKHAHASIPAETKRILNGLYLRQRGLNQAYAQVLLQINALLEEAGIRSLVLKGLALAYEYYPDPALRSISDIDLLLNKDDVLPALDLLNEAGFHILTPLDRTSDLLPKELTVSSPPKNGLVTRIELHHFDPRARSVVDHSLDDEFSGFHGSPHPVQVGESAIHVPDPMDTLAYLIRHLTRHMFVSTTSHPLPLKWIADIVCLVEHHAHEIDWQNNTALLNQLEVIYSLTPFPEHLADVIPIKRIQPPKGVNRYPQGWPQEVKTEWKRKGLAAYITRTLLSPSYVIATLSTPSRWWLRLQYGVDDKSVFWYGNIVYRLQVLKMAFAKFLR